MICNSLRRTLACGAMLMAASAVNAHVGFNGGGDGSTWEDTNNWTDGVSAVLPFLGPGGNDDSRTFIGTENGLDGNPAASPPPQAVVSLSSTQTIGTLQIGMGVPGDGVLNHSAGKLTTGWSFVGALGGNGEYNMSGTAEFESRADTTGGNVQIFGSTDGAPAAAGDQGVLRIADNAYYNGWETWFGVSNNSANRAMGLLEQTGGTLRTEIDLIIGRENADATFNLNGGDVSVGRVEMFVNDNGTPDDMSDDFNDVNQVGALSIGRFPGSTGSLRITGDDATITTTNLNLGTDFGNDTGASATLLVTPEASGLTSIDASGDAFLGNAFLGVIPTDLPTGDIPLINVDGTLTGEFNNFAEGQVLPTGTHFLTYMGGDGNDVVLKAVIPEPSAAVLLALVSLSGLVRRS